MFLHEWLSSIYTLVIGSVGAATTVISVIEFFFEKKSQGFREWTGQMKPHCKLALRMLGIILIIVALIWTATNLFNEQQNKIFSLTHLKPFFQHADSWGNETYKGNITIVQGYINFTNAGNGTAYQLQARGCYATESNFQDLTLFSYLPNKDYSVYAGDNFVVPIGIGNYTSNAIPQIYLYCELRCSDSQNGGNWSAPYEQWLVFSGDLERFFPLTQPERDKFEPLVSASDYYGNKTWDLGD